jgi:hypothetical protein
MSLSAGIARDSVETRRMLFGTSCTPTLFSHSDRVNFSFEAYCEWNRVLVGRSAGKGLDRAQQQARFAIEHTVNTTHNAKHPIKLLQVSRADFRDQIPGVEFRHGLTRHFC